MMLSLTSFSVVMAFSMSRALPIAMVEGSCTISIPVGEIWTRLPAIATTDAAEAAMDAMRTVTLPG